MRKTEMKMILLTLSIRPNRWITISNLPLNSSQNSKTQNFMMLKSARISLTSNHQHFLSKIRWQRLDSIRQMSSRINSSRGSKSRGNSVQRLSSSQQRIPHLSLTLLKTPLLALNPEQIKVHKEMISVSNHPVWQMLSIRVQEAKTIVQAW